MAHKTQDYETPSGDFFACMSSLLCFFSIDIEVFSYVDSVEGMFFISRFSNSFEFGYFEYIVRCFFVIRPL